MAIHARPKGVMLVLPLVGFALAVGGCAGEAGRLEAFLQDRPKPVSGVAYRVLPPDVVTIRSAYVPEINGVSQQIRPDGVINLPLVGEIDVVGENRTGLTPREIEQRIIEKAKDYYDRVDATVSVTGYNSQKLYVFGQVGSPGPQPWTGANTVLDVLAQSQPTQLAWPERILLVRGRTPRRGGYLIDTKDLDRAAHRAGGGNEVADAGTVKATADPNATDDATPEEIEAKIIRVDMMRMVKSGDMSHNVYLQPDDMLYVPANPLAAVGLAVQQLLFPVRPATETLRLPATTATAIAP